MVTNNEKLQQYEGGLF